MSRKPYTKVVRLPAGMLHVETPLGIVNVRVGLTDDKGRAVDAVEIIPSNHTDESRVIQRGTRLIQTTRKNR